MESRPPGDVTRVLERLEGGDRDAVAELLPLVYDELHALAQAHMARERGDHTLQPTALVNEAYLRLADQRQFQWQDRKHFFHAAAAIMRNILINHARDRRRHKRGGDHVRVPWEEQFAIIEERAVDLLALDEALDRLSTVDPRQATLVELRFFAGLSTRESAEILGVSPRTAQLDWNMARAWLRRELNAA